MGKRAQAQHGSWGGELSDFAHAFGGAFLFGVPMLYTMEMWWIGTYTEPTRQVITLALAFAVNLMLAYLAGFRREESVFANISQAIESLAVGIVAAVTVLMVLNRIEPGDPIGSVTGKVVMQVLPLSIGAAAANALLSGSDNSDDGGKKDPARQPSLLKANLLDAGKTAGGGLFIGFSISPTQEVPMLAAQIQVWHEVALVGLSLLVSYIIVFQAGFRRGSRTTGATRGAFQRPITETLAAYTLSLLIAAGALLVFQQIDFDDPLGAVVVKSVVLGLPVCIGGAAGRALL